MDLVVATFGAFVSKHQGRLRVQKGGERLAEAPLLHLEQVVIASGGVSLSSDVVRACCEEGIPIHFVGGAGRPYGGLYSAGLTGTVLTRRAQLLAYTDERGPALARAFVTGKLRNQANLLRYMAKYRKQTDPALHAEVTLVAGEILDHVIAVECLPGATVDELRETLMGEEGRAAQRYWGAIQRLLLAEMSWPGRVGRGATDPLNSALNYGYGILYAQVERALLLAGLDPYAGFLHADRPGKPSLTLDLIEEFRQAVVDRTVIGQVNKGVAVELDEAGRLTEATRRRLAEKVLERLESTEGYEGKRHPLRHIIQCQARHLATFVRGERPAHEPFVQGW